ncbi:hypothetical protein [Luedemannella flava]
MRGKLLFLGGLAVGYVLGSKAGRQRYEQIVAKSRQVWESPTVQEAAGVVQAQATKLYDQGKQVVTDKLHSSKNGRTPALASDADQEGAWDTASRRAGFTADAF